MSACGWGGSPRVGCGRPATEVRAIRNGEVSVELCDEHAAEFDRAEFAGPGDADGAVFTVTVRLEHGVDGPRESAMLAENLRQALAGPAGQAAVGDRRIVFVGAYQTAGRQGAIAE